MHPEQLKQVFEQMLKRVEHATAAMKPPAVEPGQLPTLCDGRHPAGMVPCDFSQLTGAGGYLARMAHYESAAVTAFQHLADELGELGAPFELVTWARAAAREEVGHAKAIGALAVRRGHRVPPPRLKPAPLRSLEEVAIENAAEGCVREAFGALVGLYQAEHATAADVRAAMRVVARDEVSHAALSFELDAHFELRLDEPGSQRVCEARELAMAALLHQVFVFEDAPWRDELGLPPADVLFDLARQFRSVLGGA